MPEVTVFANLESECVFPNFGIIRIEARNWQLNWNFGWTFFTLFTCNGNHCESLYGFHKNRKLSLLTFPQKVFAF